MIIGGCDIIIKEILTKKYNDNDFPFYDNNPRIPKTGWIILFLSLLLSFIFFALLYDFSVLFSSALSVIIILIPLLYYCNWDYSLIMHKIDKDELKLALIMFVFYIVYAMIVIVILDSLGLSGTGEGLIDTTISLEMYVSLIFNMMFEELLKFVPLMFFMRLFYKFSENRNISFVMSSVLVLAGFGLLHYTDGLTIYSVLLIQGLGTIFELYGYYKTKNILVPYMSHLITDAFLMGLAFIPI